MITLSHEVGPGGELADYWQPGPAVSARVPGSVAGDTVVLARDWELVLAVLRHRDLSATGTGHAMAGVSLQRRGGLLRLGSPHVRDLINPIWRRDQVQRFRPALRALATAQVRDLRGAGEVDLVERCAAPTCSTRSGWSSGCTTAPRR